MISRIDTDGNIITKAGEQQYLSGEPALLQTLANRLRLLRGEAVFAPDAGVDYEYLFNSNNHSLVTSELSAELLRDNRVAYLHTSQTFRDGTLCVDIQIRSM